MGKQRTKMKWQITSNMFGVTCELKGKSQTFLAGENIENDVFLNQMKKQITKKFFWFRAPKITTDEIQETVECISNLDGNFSFDVWETDGKLDASLKVVNESDAATIAWSLTRTWMKWDEHQEEDLLSEKKPVKIHIEKDSDGNITGVKADVTVKTLAN